MGASSAATIIGYGDKLTALWLAVLGTDASGYGLRTNGASAGGWKKANDLTELVKDTDDNDQIVSLLAAALALQNKVDVYSAMSTILTEIMNALDAECLRSGGVLGVASINTLDTFLTYYNVGAGGDFGCLMPPDFRNLYYAAKRAYPSAWNVYQEILQGSTYTNGLRKLVVTGAGTGNQTAGQDIDSTQYAGGVGQVVMSGITGSGVVTVTGTWRDTDGNVSTGAGTATVNANNTFVLTPPTANALLLTVTGITAANGITAGTLYAEAKRPSGRTQPPT